MEWTIQKFNTKTIIAVRTALAIYKWTIAEILRYIRVLKSVQLNEVKVRSTKHHMLYHRFQRRKTNEYSTYNIRQRYLRFSSELSQHV